VRRISAQIEGLAPTRFILLIGLVGAILQGVPRFFLRATGGTRPPLLPFIVVGLTAVLSWTAALLLWWIAVRRRRWSLWATAAHLTLGLALADLLTNALGMVIASIETHGAFAAAIIRQPWTAISSNLLATLIRGPLWFLGSVVTVALGRHLSGGLPPGAPSASTGTPPEPAT
jgi:hypothetical protein